MIDPNSPNFDPGGVPDRADNRDFKWEEIGFGTSPFDWQKGFDIEFELSTKLPVKDQDGSYSCGGQAWSQYAGVLEATFSGTLEERSAKFFYAQTYQKGGGSSGRDNANVFIDQGAAREGVLTSYENGQPPTEIFMTRGQDITDTARNDANFNRGYSYAQTGIDIESIAQAVRDNSGVVIGIDGSNNGTWLSAFPKPPKPGEKIWRHWIYGGKAKLFNGVKHIGCLNSWGTVAGDQGWQWISENYINTFVPSLNAKAVWSGWTHVFNSSPPPVGFNHTFNLDLKLGMTGPEVTALQRALQIDGQFPTTVPTTGYFGTVTLGAVKKFQTKYLISPVSGFCGPITRKKLNSLFSH